MEPHQPVACSGAPQAVDASAGCWGALEDGKPPQPRAASRGAIAGSPMSGDAALLHSTILGTPATVCLPAAEPEHSQRRGHLGDFLAAYNFARRLKTLGGLTPYEYIFKIFTSEPQRFRLNPLHQMPGPNI